MTPKSAIAFENYGCACLCLYGVGHPHSESALSTVRRGADHQRRLRTHGAIEALLRLTGGVGAGALYRLANDAAIAIAWRSRSTRLVSRAWRASALPARSSSPARRSCADGAIARTKSPIISAF